MAKRKSSKKATSLEESRIERFIELTGEDEGKRVEQVRIDISMMKEMGVLVDIDVHGTSMFTARATWEELGIPERDTRRKRLKQGRKDLIQGFYIGRLRSLETRFRQSLERHSFVLQGFRPYRWVPYTAYTSWRGEWANLQRELEQLKAEIISDLDTFRDQIAADWAEIASESWQAIEARRPATAGAFALITNNGVFETLEEFADYVIGKAVSQLPSRKDIRDGLYVSYRNAMLITGADIVQERLRRFLDSYLGAFNTSVTGLARQLRSGEIGIAAWETAMRQEIKLLHTNALIIAYGGGRGAVPRRDKLIAKQEEARANDQAAWRAQQSEQALLEIQEHEARELSRMRIAEERVKLEAMREAELEHARQMLTETVSPFAEVLTQFRARIAQDVMDILASIKKNGYVRGRVAERARGLLDTYRLLGMATGDGQLEESLLELRTQLDQHPANKDAGRYDTDAVTKALDDIATLTHEAANGIVVDANAHTRAGALEL